MTYRGPTLCVCWGGAHRCATWTRNLHGFCSQCDAGRCYGGSVHAGPERMPDGNGVAGDAERFLEAWL